MRVYFQDEARFGRMDNPAYCWAPHQVRPGVRTQRVREYTYVYGAVSPQDGDLFSLILPYADTDRMEIFMDAFAKHLRGDPALLIMDQAAWHKASTVVQRYPNIHIVYQPPYSPELNPAEPLWKYLRQNHMKNHYWENMDDLEDSLEAALCTCLRQREAIRSLTAFNWMEGL
jgi:transposase